MNVQIEPYGKQKARHQKEFNDFQGMFFAFNNKQLDEGLQKVGAKDTGDIISIGHGGFIHRDRKQDYLDMVERQIKEMEALKKDTNALIKGIAHELWNHEYCITGDASDALECFGLTIDTVDKTVLQRAIREYKKQV